MLVDQHSPEARRAWELNCQVMAMHEDVELGLDLQAVSGPGLLPLAQDGLRHAYDRLKLIYSLPTALRVLADVGAAQPTPPAQPEMSDSRHWISRPQRFPRLARPAPRPEPVVQQLSLFA